MSIVLNDRKDSYGNVDAARASPASEVTRPARLHVELETFRDNFDRRPFFVEHNLAGHPLLEIPAIAALSQRLPPRLLEWNSQQQSAFTDPESVEHQYCCSDTILGIAQHPGWVLLVQIENDPLYKHLLDELLDGIQPLCEQTHPGMRQRQAFLFVSSREAFTPFHFDPEYNFLLQVRGQKTIYMWDPANRDVLPAAAIDNYYAGIGGDPRYANRNQSFRDEFMKSAWKLELKAGQGVHFPLHAPHAVKTQSDVSISLSITFRTRRSQFNAVVHNANAHIRRLGIEPPVPGTSRLWDYAANFGMRSARKTVGAIKRIAGAISH